MSNIESIEVVLVQSDLFIKNYQQASKLLFCTFASSKQYGELINISSHLLTIMNTTTTEFKSNERVLDNPADLYMNCITFKRKDMRKKKMV